MVDLSQIDYSFLDHPQILMFLFHPRPEWSATGSDAEDILIPVEKDIMIGARFHYSDKNAPNILFFHGNGEIVADYDDMGRLYIQNGVNFLPVDYRGYGRSGGQPTVTAMMRDSHVIFQFVTSWLKENGFLGPLVVMGRSLGSASALELAFHYQDKFNGLIIESGFAYAGPLLELLGIDPISIGFVEDKGFRNIHKISAFYKPTLIIHAEYDHIIPFSDGMALYKSCPSKEKRFLKIPEANHNDIFIRGLTIYLQTIKDFVALLNEKSM